MNAKPGLAGWDSAPRQPIHLEYTSLDGKSQEKNEKGQQFSIYNFMKKNARRDAHPAPNFGAGQETQSFYPKSYPNSYLT